MDATNPLDYLNTQILLWQKNPEKKTLRQQQLRAFHSPRLYEFLAWQYQELAPSGILNIAGRPFPAALIELPDSLRSSPDSLLGQLRQVRQQALPETFHQTSEYYLNALKSQLPGMWDGETYCLSSLQADESLQLHCRTGSYFKALKTCDILEFELLSQFGKQMPDIADFPAFSRELSLRHMLHKNGNPLLEDCGREAAIGISLAIFFRMGNNYHALLRTCTARNAYSPRLFHSVPSLMMQPVSVDHQGEYSILHNIFREYLEEVFDHPEMEHLAEVSDPKAFYQHPDLQYLQQLIDRGDAQLELSGMVVDLFKLRPEICAVLIIDTPEWIENHLSEKNELSRPAGLTFPSSQSKITPSTIRSRIFAVQLGKNGNLPENILLPDHFSPPGAAALFLGLRTLQQRL